MQIWANEISPNEIIRWDLFEDGLRSYIKTELIGKFLQNLTLDLFFLKLLVFFDFSHNSKDILKAKSNGKLNEYPRANYEAKINDFIGPTVQYKDFCEFCKDKGVNQALLNFAQNIKDYTNSPQNLPSGDNLIKYACGSEYKGETEKMRRSNKGILKYANGDIYEGDFLQGHRSGYGKFVKHDNQGEYQGNWLSDLRDGAGIETWENGVKFTGIWRKGKQKFGTLEWTNSDGIKNKYEGGFEGEYFDGYGIWQDTIKTRDGFWKNSLFDGQGQEIIGDIPNNKLISKYKGEWKQGKLNGKGRFENREIIYEGNFINNLYEGQGILKFLTNGAEYQGSFKSGKFHGHGEFIDQNNDHYVGSFINNMKSGNGTMKYESGSTYNGKWENNMRHGQGEMKWTNGTVYQGEFVNDKFEGKGKLVNAMVDGRQDIYEGNFIGGLADGKGVLTKVFEEMINFISVKRREVYNGDFAKGEFNGILVILIQIKAMEIIYIRIVANI